MNIADIKKKVDRFKDDWERSRQCCDMEDFSDDVLYLLSIIEQAEKALEKSVEQMRDDGGAIGMEMGYKFYDSEVIIQAIEALQAIRGN